MEKPHALICRCLSLSRKLIFYFSLSCSYNKTNLIDDLKVRTKQLNTKEKRSLLRLHCQKNQGRMFPAAYKCRFVIRKGQQHTKEIIELTAVFWFLYFCLLLYLFIPMFLQSSFFCLLRDLICAQLCDPRLRLGVFNLFSLIPQLYSHFPSPFTGTQFLQLLLLQESELEVGNSEKEAVVIGCS